MSKTTQRIERFFLRDRPKPTMKAVAPNAMLALLPLEARAVEVPTRPRFSAFVTEHVSRAVDLAARMMAAQPKGNQTRTEAALELAELLQASEELVGLVEHAVQIFLTHDAEARLFVDAIPSPLERFTATKTLADYEIQSGHALPKADGLEWLREDPFLNEHHEHWHIVYPTQGVPDVTRTPRAKDRQGELFLYMHQQMIARYEAELDAMGLADPSMERLVPYDDFGQPIPVGYQPGPDLLYEQTTNPAGYVARRPNATSPENFSAGLSRQDLSDRRQRFSDAIIKRQYGLLDPPVPVTMDNLGATLEPSLPSVSSTFYASYHGSGHNFISRIGKVDLNADSWAAGVMGDTAAAIRDPVFWRWHKHIDVLGFRFSNRLPTQDFSDAPYVWIRTRYVKGQTSSPDILLYETPKLWDQPSSVLNGGDDGPEELLVGLNATDALHTSLEKRTVTLRSGNRVTFDKLEHTEFALAIRVKNQMPRNQTITVRVFIAPVEDKLGAERTEDRYAWIELDKFLCQLPPLAHAWIVRHSSDSAVVRKPARMNPLAVAGQTYRVDPEVRKALNDPSNANHTLLAANQELVEKLLTLHKETRYESADRFRIQLEENFPNGAAAFAHAMETGLVRALFEAATVEPEQDFPDVNDSYCRCGWPYHLLLPRGLPGEGMKFRLLVVLTDWDEDRVGPPGCCGSVSFCGAVDRYPDKRPMGYPFDRPWAGRINDIIPSRRNMAFRDVRIVHEDRRGR